MVDRLLEVPPSILDGAEYDHGRRTVKLFKSSTEEERSQAVEILVKYWKEKKTFRILERWRNELWPCFGRHGEHLFSVERSAAGLFGIMRFGVHMTAFVRCKSSFGMKIWVPKRSGGKSTYPSMLDNTVAGGLMTGENPLECIIREADEEASLPEEFVRDNIRQVGSVSYIYVTDERSGEAGFIYPERQWVFDLELPDDIVPEPKDGEVEHFRLCSVEEVQALMGEGKFKPNCALVLLEFFIRHGILTPQTEPSYQEIAARVRRQMPFPQLDNA